MTIDVVDGDLLTVGGVDFPIRSVDEFSTTQMNTASFARMATLSAATKRSVTASGRRGAATAHLTGLKCTPLDPAPIRPNVQTTELQSPAKMLVTFITDGDGFVRLEIEDIRQ